MKYKTSIINQLTWCALMVLLILLMTVLSIVDKKQIQNQMRSTTSNDKGQLEKNSENKKMTELDSMLELGDSYLILAVGAEGSLKRKEGTPIYSSPEEDAEIIGDLQYNCSVVVNKELITKGESYYWIPVELPNMEKTGYVRKDKITLAAANVKNPSGEELRDEIIQNAVSYIGLRFKQYGKSLETGIDCSNYIQQLYEQAGMEISNNPLGMKEEATPITEADAKPGDIVFYPANSGYGHVALYLGDGLMINCSGHSGRTYPEGGVRICRLQYFDREEYELYTYFK